MASYPLAETASPDDRLSVSSPNMYWLPYDASAQAWAEFGASAVTAPALAATGSAFLALSWEASALRHRTWAWQDQQRRLPHSVTRWLGQTVQDLTEVTRQWSRVVMWLERCANEERHEAAGDLDRLRTLVSQAMQHQQRLWTLTQQVQEELLACGPDHAVGTSITGIPAGREEQHP